MAGFLGSFFPRTLRWQFLFTIIVLGMLILAGGSTAIYTLKSSSNTIQQLAKERFNRMQDAQYLVQQTLLIERDSHKLIRADSLDKMKNSYNQLLGNLTKLDNLVDKLTTDSNGTELLKLHHSSQIFRNIVHVTAQMLEQKLLNVPKKDSSVDCAPQSSQIYLDQLYKQADLLIDAAHIQSVYFSKQYREAVENLDLITRDNIKWISFLLVGSLFLSFWIAKSFLGKQVLGRLQKISLDLRLRDSEKLMNKHSKKESDDEIDKMSYAVKLFQEDRKALEQKTKELYDMNSELEDLVAKRTKELDEQKRMQNQLKEKDEIMIAQSRQAAMGEMIGMIAHQWRQPLAAISMKVNNVLLDIELDSLDQDGLNDTLKTVEVQVQHLSKTIDDFRNFFKQDKQKENVQINKIVDDALQMIGTTLQSEGISINLDIKDNIELETFPNEMLQVIINILSNAKDIMLERKIEKGSIDIKADQVEDAVILSICDNAKGIPDEVLPKIFEPYFTTKDTRGSSGLGLYMSKIIVEKHLSGSLIAKNTDDGACFEMKF